MINIFQTVIYALLIVACPGVACAQDLFVSHTRVDFGQKVTTEIATRPTTITLATNRESSQLQITDVQLVGQFASNFKITSNPSFDPLPWIPRGYTELGVAFQPTKLQYMEAGLLVITKNPVTTTTIRLTGTGVIPRTTVNHGAFTGHGPGQSTIGTGGDYATLGDACAAITDVGHLTGGDWTFLLSGDLVQTEPCYIAAYHTNGHTITFRPASSSQTTVTLTNNAQVIIGRNNNNNNVPNIPTNRIVFDGSPEGNDGGKALTLEKISGPGAAIGIGTQAIIKVVGDSDHVAIRNVNLRCFPDTSNNYIHEAVVYFSCKKFYESYNSAFFSITDPDLGDFPDFGTVENCDILTSGVGPMFGISLLVKDAPPNGFIPYLKSGIRGFMVRNNRIRTNAGAIEVVWAVEAEIANNTISISPNFSSPVANTPSAISVSGAWLGDDPAHLIIHGNTINFTDAETTHPLAAISFSAVTTSSTVAVHNNIITGLTAAAPGFDPSTRVAIANSSDGDITTATIAHNSISMKGGGLGTTADKTYAIGSLHDDFPYNGAMIVKNNIIQLGIDGAAVFKPSADGRMISDNNNIFTSNGSVVGYSSLGTRHVTLTEWQSETGNDLSSIALDPFIPAEPAAGTWIGPADSPVPDLHFTAYPGHAYLAPPIPEVSVDIDGDPRPQIGSQMGADEINEAASVNQWMLY